MYIKYLFIGLLFYMHCQINKSNAESITYISTERPVLTWYDTKYIKNFTFISKRLRRQDPRHYVDIYIHSLKTANHSNFKLDFYFYQFLTNRYRPSFVEMHFVFCDMLHSDIFFGQAIRNALGGRECPFPPGEYHLKKMFIPYVPKGFPFTKGRIYCNGTFIEGGVTKNIFSGSIDMEIKVAKISKN